MVECPNCKTKTTPRVAHWGWTEPTLLPPTETRISFRRMALVLSCECGHMLLLSDPEHQHFNYRINEVLDEGIQKWREYGRRI